MNELNDYLISKVYYPLFFVVFSVQLYCICNVNNNTEQGKYVLQQKIISFQYLHHIRK